MAGDALETTEKFWKIQNDRDYTKLVELFADDATLFDPQWGLIEGKAAIGEFMATMNTETAKRGIHFDVEEIQGGEDAAWARWVMVGGEERVEGVGIYKVANGKLTYYRDYYRYDLSGNGG